MAYKTTVAKSCANRSIALAELWTKMGNMGWTLVDGNLTPVTVAYTSVNISTETFTSTSHGYSNGTPCQITSTGTIPGGLAANTLYYIVGCTQDTFQLSTTYNGSAINITSQGTGNHSITEAYRVYSSNGEAVDRIPEHIMISFYTANTISTRSSVSYSVSTRSQSSLSRPTNGTITTAETGFTLWIYGNKNMVHIITKISTTYYRMIFGHVKNYVNLTATLTQAISSGSNVTITVDSTAGFELDGTYQIVGATDEGRDPITISSIVDATNMIATSVARNYSSGSKIGIRPSFFGHWSSSTNNYFLYTSPQDITGTSTIGGSYGYGAVDIMFTTSDIDPDSSTNKYILCPTMIRNTLYSGSTANGVGGYLDSFILSSGITGLTNEDTFTVKKIDYGTSTGSNTSSVMNDTTKSWVTNIFANKVVVITFGTGIGQICKIASNTATSITLDSDWTFTIVPNNTSQYIICDKAFRYIKDSVLAFGIASQEGV